MQGFWASCLSRFEKELPAQQFNTWIRPLKLDASAAPSGELRLLAPNRFVLQWVKERFVPRIDAMGAEFFSSPRLPHGGGILPLPDPRIAQPRTGGNTGTCQDVCAGGPRRARCHASLAAR